MKNRYLRIKFLSETASLTKKPLNMYLFLESPAHVFFFPKVKSLPLKSQLMRFVGSKDRTRNVEEEEDKRQSITGYPWHLGPLWCCAGRMRRSLWCWSNQGSTVPSHNTLYVISGKRRRPWRSEQEKEASKIEEEEGWRSDDKTAMRKEKRRVQIKMERERSKGVYDRMSILFSMLSIVNVCLIYAVYSTGLSDNLITGYSKQQASMCVYVRVHAGVCVCVCICIFVCWAGSERTLNALWKRKVCVWGMWLVLIICRLYKAAPLSWITALTQLFTS